jgi:hypothetical protein
MSLVMIAFFLLGARGFAVSSDGLIVAAKPHNLQPPA